MALKTVDFCTRNPIECEGFNGSAVIICIPSSLTVSGLSYIDGTLVGTFRNSGCSSCAIVYTLQYDDAQLLTPGTPLVNANIKGVVCKDCLTSWVEAQVIAGDANFLANAKYFVNPFSITSNTVDGADNYAMFLGGGGSASSSVATNITRGAVLSLYGNENAGLGGLQLITGNTTGSATIGTGGAASMFFITNNLTRWSISSAGALIQDATNGGAIQFSKTVNQIGTSTVDGADNARIFLTSANDIGSNRGASIDLYGNEAAGTPGAATLAAGDATAAAVTVSAPNATGSIVLSTASLTRWSVDFSGNLTQNVTNGGDLILNKAVGAIRQNTVDAADNKNITISGGGASADVTRGAYITVAGNEEATTGSVLISSGNTATSNVNIQTGSGAGVINLRINTFTRWTVDASGNFTQDVTNGGNVVFNKAASVLQWTAVAGFIRTTGANALTLQTNSLDRWVIGATGDLTSVASQGGNIIFATATTGIQLQSGANGRTGTFTLNGATPVVVGNTSLAAGDMIIIMRDTIGGTPAAFNLTARTNGTSFSVTGTVGDTSGMRYILVRIN